MRSKPLAVCRIPEALQYLTTPEHIVNDIIEVGRPPGSHPGLRRGHRERDRATGTPQSVVFSHWLWLGYCSSDHLSAIL